MQMTTVTAAQRATSKGRWIMHSRVASSLIKTGAGLVILFALGGGTAMAQLLDGCIETQSTAWGGIAIEPQVPDSGWRPVHVDPALGVYPIGVFGDVAVLQRTSLEGSGPRDSIGRQCDLGGSFRDRGYVSSSLQLESSGPNPFYGETRVRFRLAAATGATLRVVNLLGQDVRVLVDGPLGAGDHDIAWDGRDAGGREVPLGVYLYRLTAGGATATEKVMRLQ
jgi:hypothetical protein